MECGAGNAVQLSMEELYLDRGGDPNGMSVDARTPLQMSQEPLPKIEKYK